MWVMGVSLALSAAVSSAQSPAPLPSPNLEITGGGVFAMARQANGGMIIAGNFTSAGGVGRSGLLRLQPDGTLDPQWNPSANGIVWAVAIGPGGAVYVAGEFTSIGSVSRGRVAKLSGDGAGAVDPAWNPSASSTVRSLAIDASGAVYVGGVFNNVGGQTRSRIAKLSGNGNGAADPAWNPSANEVVRVLVADGGVVYAGGDFSSIGGQTRNRIARLSGSGAGAADPAWDPSASSAVSALALDGQGNVYAGGSFTSIGGQARNRIARLSGSGAGLADPAWNPSATAPVSALVVGVNGAVYAAGGFTNIGGASRNYIAKLSASGSGSADPDWNPKANWHVNSLLVGGAGGAIYAGGIFTEMGDQPRIGLAAIPGGVEVIFANGFQ